MNRPSIICFGEVLWDMLPTGKVAGGAPLNVAFHATNFGLATQVISRVGEDYLGDALMDFMKEKGLSTELVQKDAYFPTGKVEVQIDARGIASYKIVKPVAWDYINPGLAIDQAIKEARLLVYGSLAARNARSRETLLHILSLAKLRVFDVNLRLPYYSKELLEMLLTQADIVKMNEEELGLIGSWFTQQHGEITTAIALKNHFRLKSLIITKGEEGSFLITQNKAFFQKGIEVSVRDTIGSGDAFLAAFLYKMLKGADPKNCLEFAGKTGALVASKKGGTPDINEAMVENFETMVV